MSSSCDEDLNVTMLEVAMKDESNGKLSIVIGTKKDDRKKRRKSFWHIDKVMLPYKLHFIFFIGGMGAILPYYAAIGINRFRVTASNIAAVFTTQQFIFIFIKPLIGYIADYFNRLKAVIVGLTIIQAICCFFMITIPKVDIPNIKTEIHPSGLRICDLCNHYQKIGQISSKVQLNDIIFNQSLTCLENTENYTDYYEGHCTNKYLIFPQLNFTKIKILQKICKFPNDSNSIVSQYTSDSNFHEENITLFSFSANDSQSVYILCLHTEEKILGLLVNNLTISSIKEYCYLVPETKLKPLEKTIEILNTPSTNISCGTLKVDGVPVTKAEDTSLTSTEVFQTYQFWLYALCLIACCICISSIFTMSDTACYESINQSGSNYGNQRAWGAISWGFVSPLAGFLNDYTESYVSSWCIMVLLCSFEIWNLWKMDLVKPDMSQNIRKDLKQVFSSFEFVAFEVGVFLNGMFTGVIWFYSSWFLISIGGNKLIIGLAQTVECFLGGVPFIFLSSWFIKKFGHFNISSLALFGNGVRFFIYSYIHNPWWILPVESLHGITFGVFYASMTSFGKLNSKPGTEATSQSVLCTTYEGLGAGVGCVISGMCFDKFGAHNTFFYMAFLCAVATGINILLTILLRCKKGKLEVMKVNTEECDPY